MLQVLLILSLIGAIYCQECPKTSGFKHNGALMTQLNGTYFASYTTSSINTPCELMTWSGTGSTLQAIIQSPGCCRLVHSPDYSNTDQVTFTVSPWNTGNGAGCLTTNEKVIFKFIAIIQNGGNTCIMFTACRGEREGVYIACLSKIAPPTGLLTELTAILGNSVTSILFGLLYGTPAFDPVSQATCNFPDVNCLPTS